MRDPWEGRAADGTITTGVRADRVAPPYRPVLSAAVDAVRALDPSATLAVYGSVATGRARTPTSDVDLLTVGLPAADAAAVGRDLTGRFADRCREVAVAALPLAHLLDGSDAAYGDQVFLRHYVVVLSGPDPADGWPAFPADARAARGFNGDIAVHARRWRERLDGEPAAAAGRAVARKTLLAVAGLVSVHDTTWTTDRATAARRWAQLRPEQAAGLMRLLAWGEGEAGASRTEVERALDGVVDHVVDAFAREVGLWR
ncbi:nucleotidyltransferase domain-containing protein [Lapillicoccus jejuensis]|uniref:Nucleotidyltransferase-like protein n=1 Tax=Lapillicoccus jejuensis TaxID=402171 RepID=A0A542E2E0_9MICO|nr:nucleotidyltransferase domain-containing protein [Lapillicoccus jejuensis]TQJ09496.1 nucleotidyltransferase-like protein [Lapillicoccus jejuensis]